jgi:4-hydroxybenzoate polyprenyltransferase
MVDREDDLKLGIGSTAILFGDLDRPILAAMQVVLLLALVLTGQAAELGGWYYAAVCVAAALSLWQQFLIVGREPERCFRAFLSNHYLGMAIFIGILLDYTFLD